MPILKKFLQIRPCKGSLVRMIPITLWIVFLLIGIFTGAADPDPPPPPPPGNP